MFSGKSEELIRRLRRAQIARQRVQIFKPAVDTRYADDHIVSHSELRIPSESARTAADLLAKVRPDTEVVGHRRRAVLRRGAAGGRPPSWRGAACASSSPGSIRITSASRSSRCRSCWPSPSTSPRRAPSAWCAAIPRITRSAWCQHRSRAARRAGHLRSALPALLRSRRCRAKTETQRRQGSGREGAMTVAELAGACGRSCSPSACSS